jgi:hypothetical protein
MKRILSYIGDYAAEINKPVLFIVSVFTAILIFINYRFSVDEIIGTTYSSFEELLARTSIFLLAFGVPYFVNAVATKKNYFKNSSFVSLLFLGSLIFAAKMVIDPSIEFSDNTEVDRYWNQVFYWPALCIMVTAALLLVWRIFDREQPFYGIKTRQMNFKPYLVMLMIMVPLIAAASTQSDFLAVYPKLNSLNFGFGGMEIEWWHKLFFELSYGIDFISIELFFRGFLILAFVKFAGKDAILPMACFYCTIHFGKPLGECISSYFGGILLGIIVFHTRSILGGLMVHLGIAWLMEAGGFIGNSFK